MKDAMFDFSAHDLGRESNIRHIRVGVRKTCARYVLGDVCGRMVYFFVYFLDISAVRMTHTYFLLSTRALGIHVCVGYFHLCFCYSEPKCLYSAWKCCRWRLRQFKSRVSGTFWLCALLYPLPLLCFAFLHVVHFYISVVYVAFAFLGISHTMHKPPFRALADTRTRTGPFVCLVLSCVNA